MNLGIFSKVEVCAVGRYANLPHHDTTRRRPNTDKFVSYMRDMKALGARREPVSSQRKGLFHLAHAKDVAPRTAEVPAGIPKSILPLVEGLAASRYRGANCLQFVAEGVGWGLSRNCAPSRLT